MTNEPTSAATDPFAYTNGGVDFRFIPYDGWQEDVRTAAAFLLRERSYATPAKRLLAAFSPPAEVECGYDACRVQRGEWNERLARIATFGNIAPCPIHSEAVNG